MARESAGRPADNAFTHFFDWVDRVLEPAFGPPPITLERDDERRPIAEEPCPVCGHPMFEHVVDHRRPNAVLECPVAERLPERSEVGPLNELGMAASGRRRERYEQRVAAQ